MLSVLKGFRKYLYVHTVACLCIYALFPADTAAFVLQETLVNLSALLCSIVLLQTVSGHFW